MILFFFTLIHLLFWSINYQIKFKTFFNPISLFASALFFSTISIYFAEILGLLREYKINDSFSILAIFNFSLFFFILPWLNFKDKLPPSIYLFKTERKYVLISKLLIVIFFILFLLAFILLGGLPIFNMLIGKLDIVEYNTLIKNLPLGMLSILLLISTILSLFFSSFLFCRKEIKIHYFYILFLLFISIISSIWQGKRQGILMLFFFIVTRFAQYMHQKQTKIKFKYKILIVLGFVIFITLFGLIGQIRYNSSQVDTNELLSYTMYPPMNFALLVSSSSPFGNSILPSSIFMDILPSRFLESLSLSANSTNEILIFEPTSPSGYFYPWFKNYGYLGIFLGSILLGSVSKYFYKKRNLSENNMRICILTLWCCATSGIYNHLLTLNYFLLPILFLYFLNSIKFSNVSR
jgi:oligosaccharide repeat unit polymerase